MGVHAELGEYQEYSIVHRRRDARYCLCGQTEKKGNVKTLYHSKGSTLI